MNIPLCKFIAMAFVKLALKLDVFKMEHVFQWVTSKGRRSYLFPPQIGRVQRLLSQLLNHRGGLFTRKKTIDLKSFAGRPKSQVVV
jgi:hypothetical protein